MSIVERLRGTTRFVVLVAVWVALWGEPSVGNLLSGVLVAAAVSWLFPSGPRVVTAEDEGTPRFVAGARFLAVFAGALVVATWEVVRDVLRPRLRLAEGIVAVPLVSHSPVIATLVGNAISLTPGTLTVEIGGVSQRRPVPPASAAGDDRATVVLYVHVLNLTDAESVRADGRSFERLAVSAFGSDEDRRRMREVAP
ncbi:Na+/H+ antiporter subunit E [Rhabdothermincola salaria]|uniref:Na+/H+ antiporter subunit E n=1 Tax=Rhabdothermincola salaria TaxID=2903142 RepID=UPI001E3692C4|nr:Na+/H+ antiporter subunit E [Rhabdothermincola salaria]MCD9624637.1 Na+/H+ antiporter subunit E [Rhabdothermincola salaria]